jgi:hypothetical protein
MEPIVIVKKRSRIWMIMLVLILAALLIAGALWFIGDTATTTVGSVVFPGGGVPYGSSLGLTSAG